MLTFANARVAAQSQSLSSSSSSSSSLCAMIVNAGVTGAVMLIRPRGRACSMQASQETSKRTLAKTPTKTMAQNALWTSVAQPASMAGPSLARMAGYSNFHSSSTLRLASSTSTTSSNNASIKSNQTAAAAAAAAAAGASFRGSTAAAATLNAARPVNQPTEPTVQPTRHDPFANVDLPKWAIGSLKVFTKLLGVDMQQAVHLQQARALYQVCLKRSLNAPDFYEVCQLPDTLTAWFQINTLHMYMVLVALRGLGETGRNVSKEFSNIFWEDVEQRMRLTGITSNAIITSSLKEFVSLFYGAVVAMDEGVIAQDDAILAAALWRNLFGKKGSATDLALATRYIRFHMKELEKLHPDDLLSGKVVFKSLLEPL